MAALGHRSENPDDVGEQPDLAGIGRRRSEQHKTYVVTVPSSVPDDLGERISALHAVAICQRDERAGTAYRRRPRD